MIVSLTTFIIMIISALLVLAAPFVLLIVGKGRLKSGFAIFMAGFLCFIVSILTETILWSALNMNSVLTSILGKDESVAAISSIILSLFSVIVETALLYFTIRIFLKKKDNPLYSIKLAGGFALADSIMVILMLVLSVVIVISELNGGSLRFPLSKGIVISNDTVSKSEYFQYLFKAFVRIADLIIYAVTTFLIFTAYHNDSKWLYGVAALLHLCIDIPYNMCALETVWYWRSQVFTSVVMALVVIISIIIGVFVYKNNYKKKAA